jgi:hypothetical protein
VNTNMVSAYWLIGWRIVEAEQSGRAGAGYGERLIESLSARLTERYGRGLSVANLRNFREFYLSYPKRLGEIRYPVGSESAPHWGQTEFQVNSHPHNRSTARQFAASGRAASLSLSPRASSSQFLPLVATANMIPFFGFCLRSVLISLMEPLR